MKGGHETAGLRIAYLLPSFPEVSNTFILEQVTGMLERGHHVDLFAISQRDVGALAPEFDRFDLPRRMRHLPIPASRIKRVSSALHILAGPYGFHRANVDALNPVIHGKAALNLVNLHTAASFVQAGSYDVLHCHFGHLGILGERLIRLGAVDAALVTAFRGADLSSHYPANPKHFAALLRSGDLHLPVSAEFERRLVAAGVPAERVAVHHDGIDLRRFRFVERRSLDGVARLLFVGRLTEKKGVAYALEALATLLQDGRQVELTIIGDGRLAPSLKSHAEQLGVAAHTRFLGARSLDDVARVMADSHVLVAPSVTAANGDQEGIPTVIKEAMAAGMPVVSTQHSGIPELVEHGVNGYLAPERDATSLAAHLSQLLDHPEHWPAMGRAGRQKVEAEFDTAGLNDTLVDRYREAIAHYRSRRTRITGEAPAKDRVATPKTRQDRTV